MALKSNIYLCYDFHDGKITLDPLFLSNGHKH